jgi:hypothetical protein
MCVIKRRAKNIGDEKKLKRKNATNSNSKTQS